MMAAGWGSKGCNGDEGGDSDGDCGDGVGVRWMCRGGCSGGFGGGGWRVVESDIWDRIDRKTGIIFGFAGNARRKSFSAAAGGGGRPEVVVSGGGLRWWWLGREKVLGCIQPTGSTRMYRDLSLRTSGPK
nr:hypothetical protein [Tanacetum cinerariifolium]